MNKKVLLTLVFVLIIAFAAACGGGDDNDDTSNVVTPSEGAGQESGGAGDTESGGDVEVQTGPDFSGLDFGGRTFIVSDYDPSRWMPQPGSSEHANAVIARNRWVEETLNVNIEFRPYNEYEMMAAVLAGDLYANMVITQMWGIGRHGQANRLADLGQVPNLNLQAPYWTDFNAVNYLQFDDRILGLSGSFAPQSEEIWTVFFNRRIIDELGLDCPYELVARGEWTFDRFLEMQRAAQFDLNGDGVLDHNDRFGLAVGHEWDVSLVFFLASGNPITRTNADGTMEFNIDNPEAFAAIDQVRNMLRLGDTFFPRPPGSDMDSSVRAFVEGHSLFFAYSFGNPIIAPIFQMEDDFGIVPMPMGPQADRHLGWVSHNAPTIGIPNSNLDLDFTGWVMEALGYRAWPEEANRFEEISLTRLRSDESLETLLNLKDGAISDFLFMAQQAAGGAHAGLSMLVNTMFYNQDTMEPVSEAAAVQEHVNLAIIEAHERFRGTFVEPEPTSSEDPDDD